MKIKKTQRTLRAKEKLRRRSMTVAIRLDSRPIPPAVELITIGETVREVFGSTNWKITDTGGGLRRWQIDLYWGEDEPLGPGKLLARPRGTEFEYAYSEARLKTATRKD